MNSNKASSEVIHWSARSGNTARFFAVPHSAGPRSSRTLIALALSATLLAAWPLPSHSGELAAAKPGVEVRTQSVTPRVHYVIGHSGAASPANQGFMSNAGFVITTDGVVVFDALGTPALASELIQRIREQTSAPIKRVVISHFHPDHFYCIDRFKAAGAEIWAHRAAQPYLADPASTVRLAERKKTLAPWLDELDKLPGADHYVDGETAFKLGNTRFRLFHVGPAHTAEDLVMLVEDEGVLFAGDLIFAGRLPFVGTSDSKAWLAAIERLLTFRPKIIIAGHGRHAENAEETLRFTRDYLVYLRKTMGEAVESFTPFEDAYASTDWSAYAKLPVFHEANRINAYNTYLLMEQESLKGNK